MECVGSVPFGTQLSEPSADHGVDPNGVIVEVDAAAECDRLRRELQLLRRSIANHLAVVHGLT